MAFRYQVSIKCVSLFFRVADKERNKHKNMARGNVTLLVSIPLLTPSTTSIVLTRSLYRNRNGQHPCLRLYR
jgi:hypothetical protein